MSGDEFRAFIGAVESYQLQRGRRFRIEDDGLFIEQPTGQDHVFGLSNLAQLCRQLRREEWPDAVAAHFQSLEEAADDERFSDPQAAMPYLKVRVYPRGQMPSETLEAMVSRPLTADLVAALVLDLPTTVQTITRETVAGWPEPMEQLFEIGLKHLKQRCPRMSHNRSSSRTVFACMATWATASSLPARLSGSVNSWMTARTERW
jgi:hypothetical protein